MSVTGKLRACVAWKVPKRVAIVLRGYYPSTARNVSSWSCRTHRTAFWGENTYKSRVLKIRVFLLLPHPRHQISTLSRCHFKGISGFCRLCPAVSPMSERKFSASSRSAPSGTHSRLAMSHNASTRLHSQHHNCSKPARAGVPTLAPPLPHRTMPQNLRISTSAADRQGLYEDIITC